MLRARKAAEGWGANGTHVFLQAGSSYTPLHMQNKRAHRNQIKTKIFPTRQIIEKECKTHDVVVRMHNAWAHPLGSP